jgi:hypothetical protein
MPPDGGDGSCIGEHDAAIGVKSSFRAGVCKLNLVVRCVGKDLSKGPVTSRT